MTSAADDREFEGDNERDSDPLLDALLDEVLSGQRPPDLKQEILARWCASG